MDTMPRTPAPHRLTRERHITAACALDTIPLLAQRVTSMLWWGRRISVAHHWIGPDSRIEIAAGLTVNTEMGDRAVRATADDAHAGFAVHLAPGIRGFGFAAYASDGNTTEREVWKRYHAGDRHNITIIEMDGGMLGDGGPGRDDHVSIQYWNEHRVGQEWVVGFDTDDLFRVWQERENQGWQLGRESLDIGYCKAFAQVGAYRVRCGFPLAGDACAGADDHVEED